MLYTEKGFDDWGWKEYARSFLDLSFRRGIYHIRVALGKEARISELASIAIEPVPGRIGIKERSIHLLSGLLSCIPLIGGIVTIIDSYLFNRKHADEYKLINSRHHIPSHQRAWFLNVALLRSAYETATGDRKEKIRFLAANFLNKITPKQLAFWADELGQIDPQFLSKHHGSPIEEYRYHRELIEQFIFYGKQVDQKLAYRDESLFILTDTTQLDHLFPLRFTVFNSSVPRSSYAQEIKRVLQSHFSTDPEGAFNRPLPFPFLVDVTKILDKSIVTDGSKSAEKEYVQCLEEFKQVFAEAERSAIQQLMAENPKLSHCEARLQSFIDHNITCISRVNVAGACGIKMVPFGVSTSKEAQFKSPLINFIIHSGIFIGAINLIKRTSDIFQQRPDVAYGVSKVDQGVPYAEKTMFTQSYLFRRLNFLFGGVTADSYCGIDPIQLHQERELLVQKPHITMLGKATMDLLSGLMKEVTQEKWQELTSDPVLGKVLQTSLVVIKEHLATAEQNALMGDFNRFAQEIELVHAELSTLLVLIEPFREENFTPIYEECLLGKSVPEELKGFLKAGLGKTAVNIFAGVVAAAKKDKEPVQAVFSEGAYFEEAVFSGRDFDAYVKDASLPKVNLYLGQFNPNIDVGSTLTEYRRRDVASDVRKLLSDGRASDQLTVAVDITIDKLDSDNVSTLLKQFKDEIASGKINFVFFSSGQKFYSFGMDNYYGAPFYLVNNGDEKWKAFNALRAQPVHQTDALSTQWFCLALKYAPDSLERYRSLIFENTRSILENIPPSLRPHKGVTQPLRVNEAHKDVIPCFIDLKVLAPAERQWKKSCEIFRLFFSMMTKRNISVYSRGSFGFYHHNFSIFGPLDSRARTIRLNPGVNPEENSAVIEFFNALSERGS